MRLRLFIAVFFFACVFSYVFIINIVVLNIMRIIFLRGAYVTILISGIYSFDYSVSTQFFCFGHYFWYFPYTNLRLRILFSK